VNWTQLLQIEIESAYATTEKLISKADSSALGWKPPSGANWMTMGQLLRHISSACGAGCLGFVTGEWGLPPGKTFDDLTPEEMLPRAEALPAVTSVSEALAALAEDKELALKAIAQAGEAELDGRHLSAPWAPGPVYPLGRHLLQMVLHLERHKSQLYYYLKLQGHAVSTENLWG